MHIVNAESLIDAVKAAASQNGGTPPGQRLLFRHLGITRSDMWRLGFAKYSDLLEQAGYSGNKLNPPSPRLGTLNRLADLVSAIRRFPTKGDIKVARSSDATVPSYEACVRLAGGSFPRLRGILLDHCRESGGHPEVIELLASDPVATEPLEQVRGPVGRPVTGYVYLVKHGRDYKVGRSNNVARRRQEFALLLPRELEHVHIIETDDPEGIERYWHGRFAEKRLRGEWFSLTPEDIRAFKRRRYQ